MSTKIYNVVGLGFLIGTKKSQDDEFVYLEYPGIFSPQMPTKEGPRDIMFEAIPQFFKGRDELLKNFPLKKSLIIFSGHPNDNLLNDYQRYATQLRTRISGIRIVGGDAMKKLPKDGKGDPIIKP